MPLTEVAEPAFTQFGWPVLAHVPAPPVPATLPLASQNKLAARAARGAPTVRSAAATMREARENGIRDFELFIRIDLGEATEGVASMGV